ncbi:hypothetical protein [Microbacterium sp. 77mftsu3.1]|uniref:hypothetical protein n=1 Tax=Microbacterium sp. 77mftsu3.1 TaxID=1761802 RepID=UPI00036A2A52|nr:hypothetical protein [Microbacterium sp. 77mftsu3.1]SDH38404.1 hypothetical protein SAMN04488590_3194 [Microbacterium sp. 77mftsu3.1]
MSCDITPTAPIHLPARDPYRPVVAVDIDRVLRVAGPLEDEAAPVFIEAPITYRRDAYPTAYHGQPPWDEGDEYRATESFSFFGIAWVRSLVARGFDVVWATTWQEHANTYFADVFGIPPLPNAMVHVGPSRQYGSAEWKLYNLVRGFEGRPVLWVDDRMPMFDFVDARPAPDRALTRFQHIRGRFGITEQDVADMEGWLDLAGNKTGHGILRQERSDQLARTRQAQARLAAAHSQSVTYF